MSIIIFRDYTLDTYKGEDIVQILLQSKTRMITYLCLNDVGITLLSFIFVSGIKNKMGLRKFSSITVQDTQNESFNNNNSVNKNNEFLHWFSGFTDAEGNFLISIDRNYVKLRFKISLHIDDLKVIQVIQAKHKFKHR